MFARRPDVLLTGRIGRALNVQRINRHKRYLRRPQFDPDAATYIAAVETADGEALEAGVKTAINDFVAGCKADGIWDAIKASCILAGARTLNGCLVPLVGSAPTNFNFVSGDYNRKTGLVGNGSTKFLNSNRNDNADPQNNNHAAVFVTAAQTSGVGAYLGSNTAGNPTAIGSAPVVPEIFFRNRASAAATRPINPAGFLASARSGSASYETRAAGVSIVVSVASGEATSTDILIYARGTISDRTAYADARMSFYSIGESIGLAALDTRVSTLMTAIDGAIA